MSKIGCIIQARMGSTRLPGKVMKNLEGQPVLYHVLERVKQSNSIDEIIVATTNHEHDDVIVEEAKRNKVNYYRGSEEDVLSRFFESADKYGLDHIVRITSDCPLIDPNIIDEIVTCYKENQYKLVTNAGIDESKRTFPRGMDTEVFSFESLEEAYNNTSEKYEREHVTPYFYENYNDDIYYYKNENDLSELRLTLDTSEDYEMIKRVYRELYSGDHDFYLSEIVNLFEENPELKKINKNIQQKEVKEK